MKTSPQTPRGRAIKAIAILIVVFLLGNLTGVGATVGFIVKRMKSNVRNPETSQGVAVRFLDRTEAKLTTELKLTATERAGVHDELQITRAHLSEIRVRMVGELRELSRDTIDRLARHLPEDKRQQLRENAAEKLRPWGLIQ